MPEARLDGDTGHRSTSFCQPFQAACPRCGQSVALDVWVIVDVGERPDLAERLRLGSLHEASCLNCGHAGQVDAPLLLFRPDVEPRLLFSPAQNTSTEQDQEQAAGLLHRLQESLGAAWRDEWLAGGVPGVPRPLLPALLSGGDPQAALEQMMGQAAAEMERLRRKDPEAYAQLEQAARQTLEESIELPEAEGELDQDRVLAETLVTWIGQETLDEAEAYLGQHAADLLTEPAAAAMEHLVRLNPHHPGLPDHQGCLARAREMGIVAMCAEIRRQRQRQALPERTETGFLSKTRFLW